MAKEIIAGAAALEQCDKVRSNVFAFPLGGAIAERESRSSADTVACLERLLEEAKYGGCVGVSFVAMYADRRFIVDAVGEAARQPIFTRGMLATLDDHLGVIAKRI
jgi:hypothetical protein